MKAGVDKCDEKGLVELIKNHSIDVDGIRTYIDGKNVSNDIRTPEVTERVSYVCAPRQVRENMVALQRELAEKGDSERSEYPGIVMEGRDIGTVVLDDAELKIFMTASPMERAKRRQNDPKNPELKQKPVEEIAENIRRRDKLDSEREVAPLKPADDAVIVDTTEMSLHEVLDYVTKLVNDKKRNKNQKEKLHGRNA
jgi:cytidylate kinase